MPHSDRNPFDTPALHECLNRWQLGDRAAADELLRAAGVRLDRLARRMYRTFPNIRNWVDTNDVLQGSLIRLLRTLQRLRPANTRDFFNLAAVHIRRELIDIARHFRGKACLPLDLCDSDSGAQRPQIAEPVSPVSDDFEIWSRFHEAVDELPSEEREVVGLVFYHGWTQGRIASLFEVDERTIRRRWASACKRLRTLVGGALPGA